MPNPRCQVNMSESSPSEPLNHEQIQAITTRRNGKIIDKATGFGIPKDTTPIQGSNAPIPVILGRPFLATSNALINCGNRVMKLSFGNITVEVNIFNISKNIIKHNIIREVGLIQIICQEHFEREWIKDPLERTLIHDERFYSLESVDKEVRELETYLDPMLIMSTGQWSHRLSL
ncbi:hypothetical protein DKX38_028010 [Salix brachista]|uniref:Uncharacterized protein n=1 Tax=Salix brachista TaxID=2182728 RepID=A0A5N5J8D0_9ROSI|nr:hypothetical protein DKX38_028010 [Salix brachista]